MNHLYDDSYFSLRNNNDKKRLKTFQIEKGLINKYTNSGFLLDVGCGTGEFIENLNWQGDVYGIEVNDNAILKAKEKKIIFADDVLNYREFFDIIIFRGTIQHVLNPFEYIENSFKLLKKNGYLFFLSTPNSNSIYYKIWGDLPALDPERNYWVPSDISLINVCQNTGFILKQVEYNYFQSPYSRPLNDHLKFFLKILGIKTHFPFWKNMMDLVFQKV